MNIRKTALNLYTPPFKYKYGYIFDSDENVFADVNGLDDATLKHDSGNLALQVRGWGRIQYLETEHDNGEIQDQVGQLIAEALSKYWDENK